MHAPTRRSVLNRCTALVCLLVLIATTATAQTLVRTKQFDMGRLLPTDSVAVRLEYPELAPLDKALVDSLTAEDFTPGEDVVLHVECSVSRGRTLADVSFVPVVRRGERWMLVKNYDVVAEVVGPKYSKAARRAMQATQMLAAQSRYADHSVLASGKWVKIRVSAEGIYALTDADLKSAGFSDPTKVKLYGYGGRLLPDQFTFTGSSALIDDLCEVPLYRRDGSALFFAEGLTTWTSDTKFQTNTFSSYSYYFLTEAEATDDAPATFATLDAPTTAATAVTEVKAHALFKNDAYAWYGGGRDFYDSNDLQNGHTFRLSLPGNVSPQTTVRFDLAAQDVTSAVSFTITRSATAEQVASGSITKTNTSDESARGYRSTFTAALGEEERFTVKTSASGRMGSFYATYQQTLSTAYTTAAFTTTTSDAVEFQVNAATANTRVWQIGEHGAQTAALPGSLDGSVYKAQAESGTARFVLADIAASYPAPEYIGTIENQDLHADSVVDYVIVVPASGLLVEQAERLAAAHREKSGLSVRIVRADQLYNEFSSGTPDAAAVRRYLKMLYDRSSSDNKMPRYLLLFGDCSYDNRMITSDWRSGNPDDYLLAYERNDQENYTSTGYSIGTLHSYVTDDYYGLLDDGEGNSLTSNKIDIGIGRFICHTVADAKKLVDRALSYLNNDQRGSWKNHIWAVADVGDNNLHMNDAESVISQMETYGNPNLVTRRVFIDAYESTKSATGTSYPLACEKFKQTMKRGSLIFNYNGHGSPTQLSRYKFIKNEELAEVETATAPVWVFASCEITPYDQISDDMGRTLLLGENGNVPAVLCATRSVYSNYNRSLDMGFTRFALSKDANGQRYTLGDALRLTKNELVRNTTTSIGTDLTINKLKYALLGDPALTLAYPDEGITVDSLGYAPVTTDITSLSVGEVVRFAGRVNPDLAATTADASFSGTLTATIFMPKQTITCKGVGSSTQKVYQDYTQTLYEGQTKVENGRFVFEMMVPQGVTFSSDACLLSLYAVSDDGAREYNGSFSNFCINSSSSTEKTDTLGPTVYPYLDTPDFPDGATVGTDATLYAAISDSSSISMLSGNLGHDMELWLDGNTAEAEAVNDYFTFDYGSYTSGLLEYPLTGLTEGRHTLSLRVWDVYNNATTATLAFTVSADGTPTFDVTSSPLTSGLATRFITSFTGNADSESTVQTEVYDLAGRRVWHKTASTAAGVNFTSLLWDYADYSGAPLRSGVYFYRSLVNGKKTKTKKTLLVR